MPTHQSGKSRPRGGVKRFRAGNPSKIGVDVKTIRSIDHECAGCSKATKCCCAKYDICVTEAELQRIIPVLPEAAKFCPHLKTNAEYVNFFEEAEKGFYAMDTLENDLCVFAYKNDEGLIRCSLHTIEINHGLPLGSVKPAVCILWPLTFSPRGNVLTVHDDALSFRCNSRRKKPSNYISPDLLQTINLFAGGLPCHR
jgi:hypothetical protein